MPSFYKIIPLTITTKQDSWNTCSTPQQTEYQHILLYERSFQTTTVPLTINYSQFIGVANESK